MSDDEIPIRSRLYLDRIQWQESLRGAMQELQQFALQVGQMPMKIPLQIDTTAAEAAINAFVAKQQQAMTLQVNANVAGAGGAGGPGGGNPGAAGGGVTGSNYGGGGGAGAMRSINAMIALRMGRQLLEEADQGMANVDEVNNTSGSTPLGGQGTPNESQEIKDIDKELKGLRAQAAAFGGLSGSIQNIVSGDKRNYNESDIRNLKYPVGPGGEIDSRDQAEIDKKRAASNSPGPNSIYNQIAETEKRRADLLQDKINEKEMAALAKVEPEWKKTIAEENAKTSEVGKSELERKKLQEQRRYEAVQEEIRRNYEQTSEYGQNTINGNLTKKGDYVKQLTEAAEKTHNAINTQFEKDDVIQVNNTIEQARQKLYKTAGTKVVADLEAIRYKFEGAGGVGGLIDQYAGNADQQDALRKLEQAEIAGVYASNSGGPELTPSYRRGMGGLGSGPDFKNYDPKHGDGGTPKNFFSDRYNRKPDDTTDYKGAYNNPTGSEDYARHWRDAHAHDAVDIAGMTDEQLRATAADKKDPKSHAAALELDKRQHGNKGADLQNMSADDLSVMWLHAPAGSKEKAAADKELHRRQNQGPNNYGGPMINGKPYQPGPDPGLHSYKSPNNHGISSHEGVARLEGVTHLVNDLIAGGQKWLNLFDDTKKIILGHD